MSNGNSTTPAPDAPAATTPPPDTSAPAMPEVTVNAQRLQLSDMDAPLSDAERDAFIAKVVRGAAPDPQAEARAQAMDRTAEEHMKRMTDFQNRDAQITEQWAAYTKEVGPEIAHYAQNPPTRQGIYAASLHVAPLLSILSAVGGKMTRASGLQMLAAQTGIVQGVNQGNEQAYQDARQKWKDGLDAFMEQSKMQQQYFQLMTKAYGGRADAEEKAALASERMAGNIRSEEQKKLASGVQAIGMEQKVAMQAMQIEKMMQGLEFQREKLQFEREKAGLTDQIAGSLPQGGKTLLKDMSPAQLMAYTETNGVGFKGARNTIMNIARGAISDFGDKTVDEYVQQRRGGIATTAATSAEARITATGAARTAQAVVQLNQPNGYFDQILEVAKNVDYSNNRLAIQARNWYSNHVAPDKDIGELLAVIHETYGPLSTALSGGGARGATDSTRRWSEEEIPAATSFEALKRVVDRSRKIADMANRGDAMVIKGIEQGLGVDEIYDKAMAAPGTRTAPPPASAKPPPDSNLQSPQTLRSPEGGSYQSSGSDSQGRQWNRFSDGFIQEQATGHWFKAQPDGTLTPLAP